MVYLIHFDRKLSHAQHYLGYSPNEITFKARMKNHRAGRGAKILAAATAAGIAWDVIRIWSDAGIDFERKLKRTYNLPCYCPICKKLRKR